jgi:hypothetical protein
MPGAPGPSLSGTGDALHAALDRWFHSRWRMSTLPEGGTTIAQGPHARQVP